MPKMIDRTGHRYGRLLVLERAESQRTSGGHLMTRWRCQCDCGSTVDVLAGSLAQGRTMSCGCLVQESRRLCHLRHGMSKTKAYNVWSAIKQRCCNPNYKHFANYGGRGISLAPEWHDFAVFLRDMGERPSDKHSIERIDNDRGYEPGNCRWATRAEQARNTRRNVIVNHNGERLVAMDLATKLGISRKSVVKRVKAGWSDEMWSLL